MANPINIVVEDITTQLLTYTGIQIHSASSVGGSYSLLTTLTLVVGQYNYFYSDTAGTIATWYKYRFHNATGPVDSAYSNPFQTNLPTRKLIRQQALKDYKAGITSTVAASGSNSTTVIALAGYMYTASVNSTKRGVGTWLMPTSGSRASQISKWVSSSGANPNLITISPPMDGACATADEIEWHWFASPDDWNDAINRGLSRYYFLERVPIIGDGNAEQQLDFLPWLYSKAQVAGLWSYPVANDIERAWGRSGRWWSTRQDQGFLTLMTKPAIATTETVYLEALRQADPVNVDTDILPLGINIELAAAFAYDELLSILLNPTHTGAATVDKATLLAAKKSHVSGNLRILKHRFGPHPRWQPQQLYEEANYSRPFSSRY